MNADSSLADTANLKRKSKVKSDKFASVKDVATETGLCGATIYAHVRAGKIPSLRLGGRILIPRLRLEEMIGGSLPA